VELEAARNFGPIMSERAQTIGRHKLFVGFSYQYFNFDKVAGVSLRSFGTTAAVKACPSSRKISSLRKTTPALKDWREDVRNGAAAGGDLQCHGERERREVPRCVD
jgi:hypothetical protein